MVKAGKTGVRIPPTPQIKEVNMLGYLIVMFMLFWIFSLAGGMILAKLLWRPPGQ